MTSSFNIVSHRIQGNLETQSKRKGIHYLCEGGLEKSVPRITVCHHSASLLMPNGDPWDGFFYLTFTIMIRCQVPDKKLERYFRNNQSLYCLSRPMMSIVCPKSEACGSALFFMFHVCLCYAVLSVPFRLVKG